MKFPRIPSLLLGLCFAFSANFSHAQIVDASRPGRPAGSNDVNVGLVAPPPGDTFYRNAQVAADPSTGTISDPFAPFGSRPTTDKTGEDGSVAVRDINGVIIWIDNQNRVSTIPNSALALTLYVSNSECVVWENRYDETYNTFGSISQIVIHRRDDAGAIVSTSVTPIAGTILGTAPITRTPSGYTIVSAQRNILFDYLQDFTQYRVTFDGKIQKHSTRVINPEFLDILQVNGVPILETPVFDNLSGANTVATSADGSSVILTGDNELLWATWNPGLETITFFDELPLGNPIYVSNDRLITSDGVNLQDITINGKDVTLEIPYPIPGGTNLLQLDAYTIPGSQILLYGINGFNLQLYTIDGGLIALGAPLVLPASISTIAPRVRNPATGSLLITSEGSPRVMWVKAIVDFGTGVINGLDSVTVIPQSTQGAPLYVSNDEAVVWLNAAAPLLAGEVASAIINHYENSNGPLVTTTLTPPIIGRHVASPPIFSPDPKSQGWFIKTFQKTFNDSTVIRTYRLQTLETNDGDGDGLYDWQEEALGTDPKNADTDLDGVTDGREVFPFYFIEGKFTFQEAKVDAQNRGGTLAVLETGIIREGLQRTSGNISNGNSYWLGGQGFLVLPNKRVYRWIHDGLVAPAKSVIIDPLWASGFPTTAGGADYLAVNSNYQWVTLPKESTNGYVLQYHSSNPRKPDTDLDGISDLNEYFNTNDPSLPNSFSGVPNLPDPAGKVPFKKAAITTTYYGLVYDPAQNGHIAMMTMSVSEGRSFTYNYRSLTDITASGRGEFTKKGQYAGKGPKNLSDVSRVKMQYVQQAPGVWVVLGTMKRDSGDFIGFELRRAKYSSKFTYPKQTALTMALPLADNVLSQPRGDGAVTGRISKTGLTNLNVYLPNKTRATFSGPILDNDLLVINAVASDANKSALIGPANMASTSSTLDYDGNLRFAAKASFSGGQLISGINQQRVVYGSKYKPASKGFFPISNFFPSSVNELTVFNTRYNLVGGDFGGITKVGSWDLQQKITIPKSPKDNASASFTSDTGLLTYAYTLTDLSKNLVNAKAEGFAVTLQKPKAIRGYYKSASSSGQFNVRENDGTIPPITSITPVKITVPVTASEYYVQVNTDGDWEVLLPVLPTISVFTVDPITGAEVETQIPVISAEIVSGGVAGLTGSGNGLVKITVQENQTSPKIWQYYTLEIAGIKHYITQDFTVRRP